MSSLLNVATRRDPARLALKTTLNRGTCLTGAAAALLLMSATIAHAQDACGPVTPGSVICDPAGGPYADGIRYGIDVPAPPQDLTVVLGQGLAVETSGDDKTGVSLFNGAGGAVTLSGAGSTIVTHGAGADGVNAVALAGDVTLDVGDVSTFGYRANGIVANTNYDARGGKISISAGNVSTSGEAATGIRAETYLSDILIHAGAVKTSGFGADALYAAAHYGNVGVVVGDVATSGDGARGLTVYALGHASITADSVVTTGAGLSHDLDAGAILARGASIDIAVNGPVSTRGDYSSAIFAESSFQVDPTIVDPSIHVSAGDVSAVGFGSDGVDALNLGHGGVTQVKVGNVSVAGDYGWGVYAVNLGGAVAVQTGNIASQGDHGMGVYAFAVGSALTVQTGDVSTAGDFGFGVIAKNLTGDSTVHVGSVTTAGESLTAINSETGGDQTVPGSLNTVTADAVTLNGSSTTGVHTLNFSEGGVTLVDVGTLSGNTFFQHGVDIQSIGDRSSTQIKIGTVTMRGDASYAVTTFSFGQDTVTDLQIGAVTTLGDQSWGVESDTMSGSNHVSVQSVATEGSTSRGVVGYNVAGEVVVHVGSASTKGYYAHAVEGGGYSASVTVIADQVQTLGERAIGVKTHTGTGAITIRANHVDTQGPGSEGVYAQSRTGDVDAQMGRITTSGEASFGAFLHSDEGAISVVADTITTSGQNATALVADSGLGHLALKAGAVQTQGNGAFGVFAGGGAGVDLSVDQIATSGLGAHGLVVRAGGEGLSANVDAKVGAVTTTGDQAVGLSIIAGFDPSNPALPGDTPIMASDIRLTSGAVTTSGKNADAIQIAGLTNVTVLAGTTSSAKASAMVIAAGGLADVTLQGATRGGGGQAVAVSGQDVRLTLTKEASVSGGFNGLVIAANGTGDVTPSPAFSSLAAQQTGTAVVTNAGSITAGDGYAVLVQKGRTDLTNTGLIRGAVSLAEGDDVVANSGTFAADKDSDFGAGSDRFVNTGVVAVLAGTGKAGSVTFTGLERFENAGGLVDLRNGHTGDVLTLTGDYVASGDARLGLDVAPGAADTLVVAGAASGKTALLLNGIAPGQATLASGGPVLVKVGAGSAPDAFSVANPDIGFIRYALKYDARNGGYALVGTAGQAVYRQVKFVSATQDVWGKSAQAWSSHLSQERDGIWGGQAPAGRVWGQIQVSSTSRDDARTLIDGAGAARTAKLDYRQDDYGFQIGADLLRKATAVGDLTVGVTGGYLQSKLDFARSRQKGDFNSASLGGYVSVTHGGLFANGLAQYAHHTIDAADADLAYLDRFKGQSYGLQGEVGARLGSAKLAVEPLASLTYVRTSLNDMSALGQTFQFDKLDGFSGKLGGKIAGRTRLESGQTLVFSAGAAAVHAFDGQAGVALASGGQSQHIGDDRAKTYGQVTASLTLISKRGFTAYAEGQGDVGDNYKSGTARVGVRLDF